MEVSYKALILLPPTSSASIAEAEDKLRTFYRNDGCDAIIQRHETVIEVIIGEWNCCVYLSSEPHVLVESQEMAELFAAARPDREEIATCNRRFEVIGTDPNMDYFNDYLFVLQVLESFPSVKVWEGAAQEFI